MHKPPYKLASPAPTTPRQQYVYQLVYGPTDSGKSTYALTAPGPICYFHCAGKVEGLIQRASTRHIAQFGYPMGEHDFSFPKPAERKSRHLYLESVELAAAARWKKFCLVYEEAFTYARTIIIDSEWALYQLLRYAYFGGDSPDFDYERKHKETKNVNLQALWGPVNRDWFMMMRQMVKCQLRGKTNVILITHAGDEYKEEKVVGSGTRTAGTGFEKKTGRLIPRSQARIPYWVDTRIETRCEELTGNRYRFHAAIRKPWGMNESARGVELDVTGNDASFEDIMFEITDDLDRWCE